MYSSFVFLVGSIIPIPPSLQGWANNFLNSSDIGAKPLNKAGIYFSLIFFSTSGMKLLMSLMVRMQKENLRLYPDVSATQPACGCVLATLDSWFNSSHNFEMSVLMWISSKMLLPITDPRCR